MLSVEANERLTRVGPGTPMGNMMRRYWMPVRPTAELLSKNVIKVRLLGEDLVLFRTKKGEMGLIGDRCAHRFAGLEYGIPDDDGIRCPYHGWLYGLDGQCLDTPLEPAESTFKERIKLTGYPVKELGGLVWTYMGPDPMPVLPEWPPLVWPNSVRQIGFTTLPCNWLQCQENTGDPTHSVYLHGHLFKYTLEREGLHEERAYDTETHRAYASMRQEAGIESVWAYPNNYGFEKGVRYSKALGAKADYSRRHSTVVFPFITGGDITNGMFNQTQFRVPIDDTHTYHIWYECIAAPPGVEAPPQPIIPYYEYPVFDRNGDPILDYVLAQDMVAWWSQGPITERNKEKLGRTDIPVILLRRQLEQQLRIMEDGGTPMNLAYTEEDMRKMVSQTLFRTDEEVINKMGEGVNGSYREQYQKGYWRDDPGRYGPASEMAQQVQARAEEAYKPTA
ncbi:MAG: Rieske 2Fe-2S domain-containing protein [Dehalococcoidia bacterium]